jgi:hypothetical protein
MAHTYTITRRKKNSGLRRINPNRAYTTDAQALGTVFVNIGDVVPARRHEVFVSLSDVDRLYCELSMPWLSKSALNKSPGPIG